MSHVTCHAFGPCHGSKKMERLKPEMSHMDDRKTETTFFDWLKAKRYRDGPKLDFKEDALTDHRFPSEVESWERLKRYLFWQNACEGAIKAGRLVWRDYARHRRAVSARPTLPTGNTDARKSLHSE